MISVRNRDRFNDLLWGPWAELERFQREIDQLFAGSPNSHYRTRSNAAANLFANDERAVVQLAMPGFAKESIDLSIEGKTLNIRAQQPAEAEASAGGVAVRHREFQAGDFERAFELPFAIATDDVSAQLNNGVLEIQLPRAESDKPRKITISS